MDLNEISVFVSVVKAGSFSQAARHLGMPNSTVSAKVSSLEKRLGVTLLQRTTRKLAITEAGRAYYERCTQGLGEILAAESQLAAIQAEPQGLLRITAPVELGGTVLPAVIAAFQRKYPKVRLNLLSTDRTVDLVAEGIDLAIRAGHLADSALIAKKLGETYFALFASPRYLKEAGTPTHPRDLKSHACLSFAPVAEDEWQLSGEKGRVSIKIEPKVRANDLNLLRALALAGAGITLLPSFYCRAETKSGKLVKLLPAWQMNGAPVHFVYPGQRHPSAMLSAFVSFAADGIRQALIESEL